MSEGRGINTANTAKYLRLMAWVSKRYRRGGGIVTYTAGAVPTRYTVIEQLAWGRYCGSYDMTAGRWQGVANV